MNRLLIFCALAFVPFRSFATTWYASDCPTGGSGTNQNDPICLNGGQSFAALFDGAGNEAAPGDTIYLCCGGANGCNDSGQTCMYALAKQSSQTGASSVFVNLNGINPGASPITFAGLPGDTVFLSGDHNGDGIVDSLDVGSFLYKTTGSLGFVIRDLTFEYSAAEAFYFESSNGSAGWDYPGILKFHNVAILYGGRYTWNDADGIGNNVGCTIDHGDRTIYTWGLTDDFTFENGRIYAACTFALRDISGWHHAHTYLVQDSSFENIKSLGNWFDTWDYQNSTGEQLIWQRNTAKGYMQGIGIEEYNHNPIVQDSEFWCPTSYDVITGDYSRRECWEAISVDAGDNSPKPDRRGGNSGLIARRNKIHGSQVLSGSCPFNTTGPNGCQRGGINWGGANTTGDSCYRQSECTGNGQPWCCCIGLGQGVCNSATAGGTCSATHWQYKCDADTAGPNLIENNEVWAVCDALGQGNAVTVESNTASIIQNNTLYTGCAKGIVIGTGTSTVAGAVTHTVINNGSYNFNSQELSLSATCGTGGIQYNSLWDDDAGTLFSGPSISEACSAMSGPADAFNNLCVDPRASFIDVGSIDPARWDMHWRCMVGTPGRPGLDYAGAMDDIDHQSRPAGANYELGADDCSIALTLDDLPLGPVAPITFSGKVHIAHH